jgi:cytochrome c oxidase subunit 2
MKTRAIKRLLAAAAGVACLALALAGPAHAAPERESGWSMPRDVSVDGHRIDWLINVTTIFVGILFVIMCIWMVYAAVKHNHDHEAEYDHGDSGHAMKVALTISAVIFLIVDGNLFVNSMLDLDQAFWNFKDPEANAATVRIEINAHQWAWDARYAGEDGEFNTKDDIVTLNDIRIPVDAPVIMQVASVDVIHSFYLPNFRVKQDAVPGMVNHMTFQATETGEFEIGCAQHCGVNHYLMKGILTVMDKADYKQWAAEMSRDGAARFDETNPQLQWGWPWEKNI